MRWRTGAEDAANPLQREHTAPPLGCQQAAAGGTRLDDDVARRVLNVANSSEVAELRRGCGWRGEGAVRLVCAAGPTRGELRRPGRSW